MQGGSLYHFYDGLCHDPAERRTHDLPCERRTRYRLSQPDTVNTFRSMTGLFDLLLFFASSDFCLLPGGSSSSSLHSSSSDSRSDMRSIASSSELSASSPASSSSSLVRSDHNNECTIICLLCVELAWRSGSVMYCHATAGVRFPVGTVYLLSFTSFARDSKWGCRL